MFNLKKKKGFCCNIKFENHLSGTQALNLSMKMFKFPLLLPICNLTSNTKPHLNIQLANT